MPVAFTIFVALSSFHIDLVVLEDQVPDIAAPRVATKMRAVNLMHFNMFLLSSTVDISALVMLEQNMREAKPLPLHHDTVVATFVFVDVCWLFAMKPVHQLVLLHMLLEYIRIDGPDVLT